MTYLLSLDRFSPSPKIYYKSLDRYENSFGSVVTVLSRSLIIILAIILSISHFSGKKTSIFVSRKSFSDYSINIRDDDLYFRLADENGVGVDPSVAEVVPFIYNGENFTRLSFVTTFLSYRNDSKEYLIVKNLSSALGKNETVSNNLVVVVAKCQNNTENNSNCKNEKEIDNYLNKTKIYLKIHVFNEKNSISSMDEMNNEYVSNILISTNFVSYYRGDIRKFIIEEDNNFVIDHYSKKADTYSFDGIYIAGIKELDEVSFYPNTLISLFFNTKDDFATVFRIKKEKFTFLIGVLGGNIYIIQSIFQFITITFTEGKMFVSILNMGTSGKKSPVSFGRSKEKINQVNSFSGIANSMYGINGQAHLFGKNSKRDGKFSARNISYCFSFRYHFSCFTSKNKKFDFIRSSELVVKKVFSCEHMMKKLILLEHMNDQTEFQCIGPTKQFFNQASILNLSNNEFLVSENQKNVNMIEGMNNNIKKD